MKKAVVDRAPEATEIERNPHQTFDASQAWFWTERWQRMERDADADIAAGRVARYDTSNELLTKLDRESTKMP